MSKDLKLISRMSKSHKSVLDFAVATMREFSFTTLCSASALADLSVSDRVGLTNHYEVEQISYQPKSVLSRARGRGGRGETS